MNLVVTHQKPRVRDAVHAATAPRRGISVILSADHNFDGIAGLERLDPHDAARRLVPSAGPELTAGPELQTGLTRAATRSTSRLLR